MKRTLYIIVDVSGSMNEMGKKHLQRNLCRYAVQLKIIELGNYADFDIHFYQWGQSVSEFVPQSDGDIPLLVVEGSSSLISLSDFLSKNLNDSEDLRVLILSDGNFSSSDILSFKQRMSSLPNLIIRTVAVGADADLLKLKKISSNYCVHLPENIVAAIECTILGSDDRVTTPETAAQIRISEPAKSEEDWDA